MKGTVVLGGNTRVLMEFRDDVLQVFYVLDIVNNARNRVDIGGPLIIDLPTGAGGAAMLEGSSPYGDRQRRPRHRARVRSRPAPRRCRSGSARATTRPDLTIEQTWPVALEQVTVGDREGRRASA